MRVLFHQLGPAGHVATSFHAKSFADILLTALLGAVFILACSLVLIIGYVIVTGSLPILAAVPLQRFVFDTGWHPTMGSYGLAPMLAGSALAALGAICVALPLAIAIAAALHFFIPLGIAALARGFLFIVAATPTVIFGLWGLTEVVPFVGRLAPPGTSLLAGIVLLTLMILPTTALLIDAALAKVPRALIHGAHALGASPRLTCFGMALPTVRAAVVSAGLLGLGRALGETMVVLMVTGNRPELPGSLLDPVRTLTANVALEMGYAQPLHASALFLSILLLFLSAGALALAVHLIERRQDHLTVDA
jgi:phosphate transport system permease protein